MSLIGNLWILRIRIHASNDLLTVSFSLSSGSSGPVNLAITVSKHLLKLELRVLKKKIAP